MNEQEVSEIAAHAISVEAWFAQPKFRPSSKGDVHIIEFHVAADDWENFCKNHARNVPVRLTWWASEVEDAVQDAKPEKPQKAVKGPFGQLWRQLHQAGFVNCPGVREEIERQRIEPDFDAWEVLRCVFGVSSLTYVSADEIMQRFPGEQIKVMVDQAIKKATETR